MMQTTMLTLWLMMAAMMGMVRGHGMVIDPPQRSSMWRFGYKSSPRNYDDNALYCGGFARQWRMNQGKCGVCGDPYDAPSPRPNEAGGRFATGVIVKTYTQGQVIDVAVRITANHMGYFVFKLCPNNNVKKEATQDCLDQHVLNFVGPNGEDLGTKFYIDSKVDTKYVRLQLPADLTCSQCVMQWTYNAGNSWGCDSPPSKKCCIGCGNQENFVNCVDIAITSSSGNSATDKPKVTDFPTARPATEKPVVTSKPQRTTSSSQMGTTKAAEGNGSKVEVGGRGCRAAGVFAGRPGMDQWCVTNCGHQFCPPAYCTCS